MNLLTEYFRGRLAEEGIEGHQDLKVFWSLGACQGDGLSFAHEKGDRLTTPSMQQLIHAGYRGEGELRFALLRAAGKGLTATISQSGHYVHEYTMDAEIDESWIEDEDRTLITDAVVNDLQKRIKEYSIRVAQILRDEGYRFYECFRFETEVVREIRTPTYLVRISHLKEEVEHFDTDPQTVADMANGKVEEVFGIEVAILDAEDECELASANVGYVVRYKDEDRRHFRYLVRELLAECCDSMRPRKRQPAQIVDRQAA